MAERSDGDRADIGRRGEDAATVYLERCGMAIIERNWRTKAGELDIVAREGSTLVLIEVKTRATIARGTPEEAVTPAKQRRLARLARQYIAGMDVFPERIRFDVVTLLVLGADKALLRHHRNAFEVSV